MLRTFDENLVITAVQQLTTDLDSLSGRIKKLEEGGGGGGWELVTTKEYNNVTITENLSPYDTIILPSGFLLNDKQLMMCVITYESSEPDTNKMVRNISIIDNALGKLSGYVNTVANLGLYYNNSSILSEASGTYGITIDKYKPATEELVLNAKYGANYGITNADITANVYVINIPE